MGKWSEWVEREREKVEESGVRESGVRESGWGKWGEKEGECGEREGGE